MADTNFTMTVRPRRKNDRVFHSPTPRAQRKQTGTVGGHPSATFPFCISPALNRNIFSRFFEPVACRRFRSPCRESGIGPAAGRGGAHSAVHQDRVRLPGFHHHRRRHGHDLQAQQSSRFVASLYHANPSPSTDSLISSPIYNGIREIEFRWKPPTFH